eukprot:1151281-Pelagomonas_calceolata.AAC.2
MRAMSARAFWGTSRCPCSACLPCHHNLREPMRELEARSCLLGYIKVPLQRLWLPCHHDLREFPRDQ